MDDDGTPIHHASSYVQLIDEISNLERYYDAKVMASSPTVAKLDRSVHFGTRLTARTADVDAVSIKTAPSPDVSLLARWVPLSGLPADDDDYPSSALKRDGLL
jgi:hypothetical protein